MPTTSAAAGNSSADSEAQLLAAAAATMAALRLALKQAQDALLSSQRQLRAAQRLARGQQPNELPGRQGVFEVGALAGSGRVLTLLRIDLQGLQAVRTRHGVDAAESLMQLVAARLTQSLRRGDRVSRHGGDSFLCLLRYLHSPARAKVIAHKLVSLLTAPWQLGPHNIQLRASIGIALYPRDGDSAQCMLQGAEAAMQSARRQPGGVAMAEALSINLRSAAEPGLSA
jgi:diguanylate cyclase (GGDEF)-like protein